MEERLPPPAADADAAARANDCARDPVLLPAARRDEPDARHDAAPMVVAEVPAEEVDPTPTVLRRVRKISVVAYVAFAAFALVSSGFPGFLALTCSALVVMINFLWLEEIVRSVLQPAPHLHAWKLTLRTLARFVLLGAAISVTIIVARFNAFSVLLGFSVVVVGIIGEAVYSTFRSFG